MEKGGRETEARMSVDDDDCPLSGLESCAMSHMRLSISLSRAQRPHMIVVLWSRSARRLTIGIINWRWFFIFRNKHIIWYEYYMALPSWRRTSLLPSPSRAYANILRYAIKLDGMIVDLMSSFLRLCRHRMIFNLQMNNLAIHLTSTQWSATL